jgi:hypothetical protein
MRIGAVWGTDDDGRSVDAVPEPAVQS